MTDRYSADTINDNALDQLYAERDRLRTAILDIDAHATPNGLADPDDPDGNPHHYMVTVGALHRALGKIGHTAPLCQAEAERDGAYRERAHLVAHLAAIHPSHIGYTDPNAPEWAVVTIETPAGQMSWHIAERDMGLFAHVQPTNRICRSWDGHSTDEKYERLQALIRGEGVPLFRAERAEAAIARVRALADSRQTSATDGGRTDADTIWPSEILTALDEPPAPKICELPHQTIEEENACEQQRLVLDEPKDQ